MVIDYIKETPSKVHHANPSHRAMERILGGYQGCEDHNWRTQVPEFFKVRFSFSIVPIHQRSRGENIQCLIETD